MGDTIGFGEGLPRDVGRSNTAFRFATAIIAVAIDTREDSGRDGKASLLEHRVDLVARKTTAPSVDVLATLGLWSQGGGPLQRYYPHVNQEYEDQN